MGIACILSGSARFAMVVGVAGLVTGLMALVVRIALELKFLLVIMIWQRNILSLSRNGCNAGTET